MVDNKHLSEFVYESMQLLTYEQQVSIWNNNCRNCGFSCIELKRDNKIIIEFDSADEAEDYLSFNPQVDGRLMRSCLFGGEKITLKEITSNTCRLWYNKTDECGIENPDNEITAFQIIVNLGQDDVKEPFKV